MRQQRAYTLVELLLVLTLASVLIALSIPGLQSALATVRNFQCKGNLKQIGTAYANFNVTNTSGKRHFDINTWQEDLVSEMEDNFSLYTCPNSDYFTKSQGEELGEVIGLEDYSLFDPSYTYSEFGGSHDVPLEEGCGRYRRCTPDTDRGWSSSNNRDGRAQNADGRYGYGEDYWINRENLEKPEGAWMTEYEDWKDWDWSDLVFWIQEDAEGLKMTVCAKYSGHKHQLRNPDGELNGGPLVPGEVRPIRGIAKADYGMTALAREYEQGVDADKILVVDYMATVVRILPDGLFKPGDGLRGFSLHQVKAGEVVMRHRPQRLGSDGLAEGGFRLGIGAGGALDLAHEVVQQGIVRFRLEGGFAQGQRLVEILAERVQLGQGGQQAEGIGIPGITVAQHRHGFFPLFSPGMHPAQLQVPGRIGRFPIDHGLVFGPGFLRLALLQIQIAQCRPGGQVAAVGCQDLLQRFCRTIVFLFGSEHLGQRHVES